MARFRPLSLLIEIDQEYWPPETLVLRAPTKLHPEKSRVIFHETLHFWQQISQTFLVKMADEDWDRLTIFESTGNITPVGPIRREYTKIYEPYGYSARDLQEAVARYWDVHVINPTTLMDIEIEDENRHISLELIKEYKVIKGVSSIVNPTAYSEKVYELAMSFAAGNYAKPYIHLRDKSSSFFAAVVFPLAGHFALQSDQPVPFFVEIVNRSLAQYKDIDKPGAAIIDVWPLWYYKIRNIAVEIQKSISDRPFYTGGVVMSQGSLADNPAYNYLLTLLVELLEDLNNHPAMMQYLVPGYDQIPSMHAKLSIDFFTACPGIPDIRTILVSHLAPPYIRFLDGQNWMLRLSHLKETFPNMGLDELANIDKNLQTVADQIIDVDERWTNFRWATMGINE